MGSEANDLKLYSLLGMLRSDGKSKMCGFAVAGVRHQDQVCFLPLLPSMPWLPTFTGQDESRAPDV